MQVKINQNSAYAPIRYEATRPYASRLGKQWLARLKTPGSRDFYEKRFPSLVSAELDKLGTVGGPGPYVTECTNVTMFGLFESAGKVIYDVSEVLTSALSVTDLGDLPCGAVPSPRRSFYIHFGATEVAGTTAHGSFVEGAFVQCIETRSQKALMVSLIPRGWGKRDFYKTWDGECPDGTLLNLNDANKPVAEELHDRLQATYAQHRAMLAEVDKVAPDLRGYVASISPKQPPQLAFEDAEREMRQAFSVVISAMFYIQAEPQDVQTAWSRDVPPDALQTLRSATTKGKAQQIEASLTKAGYTKVKRVGTRFAQSVAAQDVRDAISTGRTLRTHLRDGYYKLQHHGPERSLRKVIYVAPVVVNAGKGDELQGRIYAYEQPLASVSP